jgi:ribonuclease HII
LLQLLDGVRDSKALTAARREHLLEIIVAHALAWTTGAVPPAEIDRLGIVTATRQAMGQALEALSPPAGFLLIDYLPLPDVPLPQHHLPKGDVKVLSIAAASIVAKVHRDGIMDDLDRCYPGYGFARHKGYGTAQHRAALATLGSCPAHRMSFAPLRNLSESPRA